MTKNDMPTYPKANDPDFVEKRRTYMREYQRRLNATPEGKAANKARKNRYRAKSGVKEKERKYARTRIARMYETKKGRDHLRSLSFKTHHGITRSEANTMIEAQNGLCAICKKPPKGKGNCSRLHVDHCHSTNKIRLMLCSNCNRALGFVDENIETLQAMIVYIKSHRP